MPQIRYEHSRFNGNWITFFSLVRLHGVEQKRLRVKMDRTLARLKGRVRLNVRATVWGPYDFVIVYQAKKLDDAKAFRDAVLAGGNPDGGSTTLIADRCDICY